MDAERLLELVEAACREAGTRWAVIGGMVMNAYGHARTTLDFDIAAEERARKPLLSHLASEGFRILNDVEGFTNLRHPDPELGRLDIKWLEGTTSERLFSRVRSLPGTAGRDVPDSATSASGSAARAEDLTLDIDRLPMPTPEECEALERNRPAGVSYEEYFRFLKQFHWTEEQLRAIPLSKGPRFTLE